MVIQFQACYVCKHCHHLSHIFHCRLHIAGRLPAIVLAWSYSHASASTPSLTVQLCFSCVRMPGVSVVDCTLGPLLACMWGSNKGCQLSPTALDYHPPQLLSTQPDMMCALHVAEVAGMCTGKPALGFLLHLSPPFQEPLFLLLTLTPLFS